MLYCGIDIGTTNVKAAVLDDGLNLLYRCSLPAAAQGTGDTYDPSIWLNAVKQIFKQISAAVKERKIICSITAQGGTFILLDGKFAPLVPAVSWTSMAQAQYVNSLADSFGFDSFYSQTGWPPLPRLMAVKVKQAIAIMKDPEHVRYVAQIPEFLIASLTGTYVTDITIAQASGLYNIQTLDWDDRFLNWANINRQACPNVVRTPEIIASGYKFEGLQIDFAIGSHDQYAAMRACGLETDGASMIGTGTAWVLNSKTSKLIFDQQYLTRPGMDLESSFGLITIIGPLGRGFELACARCNISKEDLCTINAGLAEHSLPSGPIHADFTTGLVQHDGDGLKILTTYMQAAAARIRYVLDCLPIPASRLIMTGGGARNIFWMQAITDCCGMSIEAIEFAELTAYGAALLSHQTQTCSVVKTNLPKEADVRVYNPQHALEYQHWYNEHQAELCV